jgi:hypothetical protein
LLDLGLALANKLGEVALGHSVIDEYAVDSADVTLRQRLAHVVALEDRQVHTFKGHGAPYVAHVRLTRVRETTGSNA